jgi:hypothetical protein
MAVTLIKYVTDLIANSTRRLFGRSRTSNTATSQPNQPSQRHAQSGPGFGLVAFNYSPVSSKHQLPIFDRTPLGIWVGQEQENGKIILWFCNIHWLLEQPRLLTAFMKYRTNGLVLNSKTLRDRAMAQMVQIASSSPQRCLRKYRADKVGHSHRW